MLQKIHTYKFKYVAGVIFIAFLSLLSGCTQWTLPQKLVGMSEQQVLDTWGRPSARVVLPQGGVRLQYSGQPWGRYAWMVDVNGAAQVQEVYQALQGAHFAQIPVDGRWGQVEVLREFGPPAFIDHVASWQGDIWNYRWNDHIQDMFYFIYFDDNGRVRRAEAGIDSTRERFEWF